MLCIRGYQNASLPLRHQTACTQAAGPKRPHHCQQAVVAQPFEFGDRPWASLVLAAGGHGLDQLGSQLGSLQPCPRQRQCRAELAQHVAHATVSSGEVEREICAHGCPAQTWAVDDGVVELRSSGDAVVHQVQILAPQSFLEAVREVALYLLAHDQRVHHQIVVVPQCRGQCLVAGGLAPHYLDQRQQVHGVERVADHEPLGMSERLRQLAGQKPRRAACDRRHRPMTCAVAFQRVEPQTRQVHVLRLGRHVQAGKDPLDLGDQARGNPSPVSLFEQTLEASVAKAKYHWMRTVTYHRSRDNRASAATPDGAESAYYL